MDLEINENLISTIAAPHGPNIGEHAALIRLHQSDDNQPFDSESVGVRETALQNYIAVHCA